MLRHALLKSDPSRLNLAPSNSVSGPNEHDEEIHPENACGGVILEAQINVLSNAKAEAPRGRKVDVLQLVFLDLQAAVQNLVCLKSADLGGGKA